MTRHWWAVQGGLDMSHERPNIVFLFWDDYDG